ncbi:MAG: DUF3006 domain-containing protein [Clostridiaceae bacterium]|nr:DUF3006 domain-containing protein [Clostridiaceae bacterium]
MRIIIDRFEGNFAVVELENKTMVNMPVELLPAEAKEGSILRIAIDPDVKEDKKKEIQKLMDSVWE